MSTIDQKFHSTTSNVLLGLDTDDSSNRATFRMSFRDEAFAVDIDASQAAAIIEQLARWLADRVS